MRREHLRHWHGQRQLRAVCVWTQRQCRVARVHGVHSRHLRPRQRHLQRLHGREVERGEGYHVHLLRAGGVLPLRRVLV